MEAMMKVVSLNQIVVSKSNKMFREESEMQPGALQDLIDSIKAKGVIQPVLLRPKGKDQYELVCGERRYRASKAADLKDIPAYIRPLNDDDALEAQVIENLQRENVNPMKEAIAFEWMVKTKKMTTQKIADRIGKSVDYVQERIRLTTLTKEVQAHVRNGVLPLKAAIKLASVPANLQNEAIEQCIETVEGAHGKTYTFTGLSNLQDYLQYNVFNKLQQVDFLLNDATLVPAAGDCLTCTKRTKNQGSLFDDVTKHDMCLDGGCFRSKQLAQAKRVVELVKLNFPGMAIKFQSRGYSVDGDLKQKLTKLYPLLSSYERPGEELTEKQAKDLLAVEKGKDPSKAIVCVQVGPSDEPAKLKKKYIIYGPQKKTSSSQGGSEADRKKANKQREIENRLLAAMCVKKFMIPKLTDSIVRRVLYELRDHNGFPDTAIEALIGWGIKFTLQKNGQKDTLVFDGKTRPDIDIFEWNLADEDKVIESVKGAQLNTLLLLMLTDIYYGSVRSAFLKEMKVDEKSIATTARAQAAAWWKQEQEKKKQAVKKFVKSEGRKPGLKELIKK